MAGAHWQAIAASGVSAYNRFTACNNAYIVNDFTPSSTIAAQDLGIVLNCGNNVGRATVEFAFVLGGQQLGCAGFLSGNAGGTLANFLCAANQNDAVNCVLAANNGVGSAVRFQFT